MCALCSKTQCKSRLEIHLSTGIVFAYHFWVGAYGEVTLAGTCSVGLWAGFRPRRALLGLRPALSSGCSTMRSNAHLLTTQTRRPNVCPGWHKQTESSQRTSCTALGGAQAFAPLGECLGPLSVCSGLRPAWTTTDSRLIARKSSRVHLSSQEQGQTSGRKSDSPQRFEVHNKKYTSFLALAQDG